MVPIVHPLLARWLLTLPRHSLAGGRRGRGGRVGKLRQECGSPRANPRSGFLQLSLKERTECWDTQPKCPPPPRHVFWVLGSMGERGQLGWRVWQLREKWDADSLGEEEAAFVKMKGKVLDGTRRGGVPSEERSPRRWGALCPQSTRSLGSQHHRALCPLGLLWALTPGTQDAEVWVLPGRILLPASVHLPLEAEGGFRKKRRSCWGWSL